MRVFAISNRGLIVIAVLVAVLWGLIYAEHTLTLHAQRDYIEVMRSLSTTPLTPVKTQPLPVKQAAPVKPAQV